MLHCHSLHSCTRRQVPLEPTDCWGPGQGRALGRGLLATPSHSELVLSQVESRLEHGWAPAGLRLRKRGPLEIDCRVHAGFAHLGRRRRWIYWDSPGMDWKTRTCNPRELDRAQERLYVYLGQDWNRSCPMTRSLHL